jgi:hypothetical protein
LYYLNIQIMLNNAYQEGEPIQGGSIIDGPHQKISKPVLLAMMGGAALAVAGCGDPGETEDTEILLSDSDQEENIGEANQELLNSWTNLTVAKGVMRTDKTFTKTAGRRYTVCLNPKEGDPDLYADYSGPPINNYQFVSVNGYLTPDCIFFNAGGTGTYYLKAKGALDTNSPPKWGYYVTQECTINGPTISIAYDHLNYPNLFNVEVEVNAGTIIGYIYDINVIGEYDHLHLAICKDTYANCNLAGEGQYPQRGSLPHTQFPWKMINPYIVTNPNLWK